MAVATATRTIGTSARIWGVFKAATWAVTAGVPAATYALADPTAVTLAMIDPAGTTTTYTYAATITKQGTGVYYRDHTFTLAGTYVFRWTGTGAAAIVGDMIVTVE